MTNANGHELLKELTAPMEESEIEWKIQTVTKTGNSYKGLAVPYVQARAVQSRLDKVFGMNWQSEFRVIPLGNTIAVECTISIFFGGQWISRRDAAELTHIEAVKGGYSDALKRCGVQWGIGRFLYSLPLQWVEIYPNKPTGNVDYEYIQGQYTVSKKQEFIKGYFIKPSINNLLNRNNPGKPDYQTQSQPQQQFNSPQSQQQIPPKLATANQPSNQELIISQRNVIDCLQYLNIPIGYLPNLCKIVEIRQLQAIEHGTYEELQKLYQMLNPVKMFMMLGREQFKKNDQQLFSYASELIGSPVGKVSQLFNSLTSEGVNQIFNRIREEQGQNSRTA